MNLDSGWRMSIHRSEETKNQVNDVVDDLRVVADLPDAPLECSCVAHDAQQMNAL